MNSKKAKAIRQVLRVQLARFGMNERARVLETITVKTRKHSVVTVKSADGTTKELKRTAIQVRLQAGCPREIYRRVKAITAGRGALYRTSRANSLVSTGLPVPSYLKSDDTKDVSSVQTDQSDSGFPILRSL